MKVILMTAYDINPYKGSESGTGWNFVTQAARFNKVMAVTRKNNRRNIEKYIEEFNIDTSNLDFYYFDLPYYLRFWKKGDRGSSLYFYMWQMFMPLFVKINMIKFDIAHNVNFHADAFPTFLWLLGKPTVWGPINHHERIPKQYIFPKNEYIKDRIKWLAKLFIWNFDPFLLMSKLKSDIIIGGNSSVHKRLKISSNKIIFISQVASSNIVHIKREELKIFNIIIAARFIALKGIDIALYAFEEFYNNLSHERKKYIKLSILGEGPLENNLKVIRNTLNSKDNIEFIGWIDKDKMDMFYQKSSVFLFPSYEGAGMVVVEAMSHGLPVICFDNYGPGEFVDESCAIKIPYTNRKQSISDYSNAMMRLYQDKKLSNHMSRSAVQLFEEKYTWNSKGVVLRELYNNLQDKENSNE